MIAPRGARTDRRPPQPRAFRDCGTTVSLFLLLRFAVFPVLSVQERHGCESTMPPQAMLWCLIPKRQFATSARNVRAVTDR